ncbi:MAG: PIG-L family deacetylase [Algoriphagus sp.]|nr:PIG-L family deacetylase [Algoriphagus sp.]
MFSLRFRYLQSCFFFFFFSTSSFGQSLPSSQLYHQLLQLRETKRVLYVAAHPDDENTRLIAYLANGEHASVAYLSLTRGDGGQNLIGKELGIELGQIRTQELIKAREIDGGKQYFTRALDFGYSKEPNETLQNWDKEKVLADVVWAIRRFQPDLIITRFNTSPGITHGHHTTSAILAGEAFSLAGNPTVYPEQLAYVKPWQAKRLFFNAYNFRGEFEPESGKRYFVLEVGGYNPLLGKTYHQLAADSRTMHKSQGFGSTAGTGNAKDYLEQIGGEAYNLSPFEDISNRWEQLSGGKEVKSRLDELINTFNFSQPDQHLPQLLALRKSILALHPSAPWVDEKVEKLDKLIFQFMGLKMEFLASKEFGYPGEQVPSELILTNPSKIPVSAISLKIYDKDYAGGDAAANEPIRVPIPLKLQVDQKLSQPYWLQKPVENALFQVGSQEKIGIPYELPKVGGFLSFTLGGEVFSLKVPLEYKFNDPVTGEIKEPFTVVPEVDLSLSKEVLFLVQGADATVSVTVNFRNTLLEGSLDFEGLTRDQYTIAGIEELPGQKQRIYKVIFLREDKETQKVVHARFTTVSGRVFDQTTQTISYPHIPSLTYFTPATLTLIQADWKVSGEKVGYLVGAGDEVPEVLSALGYDLRILGKDDFRLDFLNQFKAIVVGIRGFNTNEDLALHQSVLMDYVRAGGNLIVQYATSTPLVTKTLGPYPFLIGRDRVTVEGSPVQFDASHSLFSYPNVINQKDFEGWVQERGLYFATQIDARYQSPLMLQDPGEQSNKGGLITAKYGDGTYVYTGLSFFRQLPAGVPGAIKLFINLIEQ